MTLLLSVPACGLASFTCLRFTPLRWNVALGLALIVSPFAPLPAAGALLGVLLTPRFAGVERRERRFTLLGRRPALDQRGLAIGSDQRGQLVRIPLPGRSGAHTLVVGATGSGKTVTEAWIVARAVEHGHGAVIVDPKGDALLRETARDAALLAGREFIEWTPNGPAIYNPYAHGGPSEIADKALAGESFSEPHYLRQAQRYLSHAARALSAAGETATPRRLAELMDPRELEQVAESSRTRPMLARCSPTSTPLTRASAPGWRVRATGLAILAESELRALARPGWTWSGGRSARGVRVRAVVYFCLEADRLPLLARMLAAAIVQDLLTVAADCQHSPVPTLVAIDEFSGVSAAGVARLFGRARSAGFSLLLRDAAGDFRVAGQRRRLLDNDVLVETVPRGGRSGVREGFGP